MDPYATTDGDAGKEKRGGNPRRSGHPVRVTYDPSADAAFVYFTDLADGVVAQTLMVSEPEPEPEPAPGAGGGATGVGEADSTGDVVGSWTGINIDFDAGGMILGIEVLGARSRLPAAMLADAEILGPPPTGSGRHRTSCRSRRCR